MPSNQSGTSTQLIYESVTVNVEDDSSSSSPGQQEALDNFVTNPSKENVQRNQFSNLDPTLDPNDQSAVYGDEVRTNLELAWSHHSTTQPKYEDYYTPGVDITEANTKFTADWENWLAENQRLLNLWNSSVTAVKTALTTHGQNMTKISDVS